MARQGYDLQLTRYDERGWRATFYTTGMEHSPTSATGTGWERTPWHATQRAAWGGVLTGRPERVCRLRSPLFRLTPLGIPNLEAWDVKLQRLLLVAERRDNALHDDLALSNGGATSDTDLSLAWTAGDPVEVVARKPTACKFFSDEDT